MGATTARSLAGLAEEQEALRRRLMLGDDFDPAGVRAVAGFDVTFLETRKARTRGLACVALHAYPSLELIEYAIVEGDVDFPYVPGFLAYRELPLVLRAYERVRGRADVCLLDAHGIAHPRGLGLAAHFGVVTGEVAIGCAKSHLYGTFADPSAEPGAAAPLLAPDGSRIGTVLRPGRGKALLFVSPGHRIGVDTATGLARRCLRGHTLPEPTRIAHNLLQEARRRALGAAGERARR